MKYFIGLMFFISTPALGSEINSRFFEIGKTDQNPLFIQQTKIETSIDGQKLWSSQIKTFQGDLVMTEKATLKDDHIVSQYVEQLQIQEAYELKIENDKATFRILEIQKDGSTKEKDKKVISIGENFLMGPMTEPYLQKRWEDLMVGKSLLVDFGVLEMSKTFGFEFKKIKETETKVEVRMKPANFFVAMLVDPLLLEFDKKEKRLIRFVGRTPLRVKQGAKWKALDAEILYP